MQQLETPGRRTFLRGAGHAALLAGAAVLPVAAVASREAEDARTRRVVEPHYLLTEVLLEDGFEYTGDAVSGTRTRRAVLEIRDGRLVAIHDGVAAQLAALPRHSAGGLLALPKCQDLHIHLDKTFYGGSWQAPESRRGRTILDMIALEERLIPGLLETSVARAEGLIELLLGHGTNHARSHCNIDPISGLRSLEHLQTALANHQDRFSCEIVAFPQHGLLRANVSGLMREAMQMGVSFVGGLDPTTVDGDMTRSLDAMFQIAIDARKGVDIHLHESGASGIAAIDHMLDVVERTPELHAGLTLSHAFALAALDEARLDATAERMAALGVTVASTVPIGRSTMPLPRLREKGVRVVSGTDSVIDMWSPFGSGAMLEKANLYAQLYGGYDEFGLSRALAIATDGVVPLDDHGNRQWPAPGIAADFGLFKASCSAEAVARRVDCAATFKQGKLVSGAI